MIGSAGLCLSRSLGAGSTSLAMHNFLPRSDELHIVVFASRHQEKTGVPEIVGASAASGGRTADDEYQRTIGTVRKLVQQRPPAGLG